MIYIYIIYILLDGGLKIVNIEKALGKPCGNLGT
jgi:hypothetical protein